MQPLTVSLVQTALHWENPEANRAMLEEQIWQIGQPTDLIALPEMFTTGFTMNAAQVAEPMNLTTFKWLRQMAAQQKACIVGSYVVAEQGRFFNRLVWMRPDGSYACYDKRHLFRMAGEHEVFASGTQRLTVALNGWRICPLICYDLRFPVWGRQHGGQLYDLLLFVANWPAARATAWNALLPARAIENLCYAVGVNRVGEDGKGIHYQGDSAIYDFKGECLLYAKDRAAIFTHTFEPDTLVAYREKFPAYLDADAFEIR